MIRVYKNQDYEKIIQLLQNNSFFLPAASELSDDALVWEEDGSIVGFIWGLTSEKSTTVFIDYFVVEKKHRSLGKIASLLMGQFLIWMQERGKTRIVGQLQHDEGNEGLARIYHALGMKCYRPYLFIEGDLELVLKNMKEKYYGKQNNSEN